MDFMRLLKSLEELLYELVSWLVFYPLTLWRILRGPLAAMDYSDREQSDSEERRYDDALSPPLFLLATIVLTNLLSMALHVPPPPEATDLSRMVYASQQNLVLFRSLAFSLIPLVAAVTLLRHLQSEHPLSFPDDRIRRTLERRVRQWRALKGPERDIIFRQTPEPGYMAQSDFTHAEELDVTIAGQAFPHLLYHFVMAFSRLEHVGVILGG